MPTSLRNICSSSISTASEASTAARIRTENRLAAGDTHFTSALGVELHFEGEILRREKVEQ